MSEIYLDEMDARQEPVRPLHRTQPLYATSGPAWTDETWLDYFRRMKARYDEPDEPEEPEPALEVLEPGEDIFAAEAPGAAGTLARRLVKHGWTVRVQRSLVHVPAVLYVTDSEEGAEKPHLKGDVRYEAKDIETLCLLGVKSKPEASAPSLAIMSTWIAGKFQMAQTYDPFLGREVRVGWRKSRKPNSVEVEEGVSPPLGAEEWLAIVAPTAAKKKPAPKVPENEWSAA